MTGLQVPNPGHVRRVRRAVPIGVGELLAVAALASACAPRAHYTTPRSPAAESCVDDCRRGGVTYGACTEQCGSIWRRRAGDCGTRAREATHEDDELCVEEARFHPSPDQRARDDALAMSQQPGSAATPTGAAARESKSPLTAFGLSTAATATAVPIFAWSARHRWLDHSAEVPGVVLGVLGFAALTAGPTAGHFYAGKRWTGALIARSISLGIGATALLLDPPCLLDCRRDTKNVGLMVAVPSVLVLVGSVIYDIATAPGAARDANAQR